MLSELAPVITTTLSLIPGMKFCFLASTFECQISFSYGFFLKSCAIDCSFSLPSRRQHPVTTYAATPVSLQANCQKTCLRNRIDPLPGRLQRKVQDAFLAILTNGKITEDKVGPHGDLLAEFPYLGPPHNA